MNLRKLFETEDRIKIGELGFRRLNRGVFETQLHFQFFSDPIITEVKKLGAGAARENLNVVAGSFEGRRVCWLTDLKPASTVAREFSFGREYGKVEVNESILKEVEQIIGLRPYYATEDALFCEITGDFSEDDMKAVLDLAVHLMAPEATNDVSPEEFAMRFREIRFYYSP